RSRLQTDRRSVQVALTDEGRTLIEALFPRHADDIAAAMGALTPAEMEQLGDLLRRLGRGAAEDAEPADPPIRAAGRTTGRTTGRGAGGGPLAGSSRTHQFSA
ncbi:MAG: hypothetical protein JSR21_19885, partial [Proteobacteria bacterium]|nr:hypothetical protein [Pseudomonadota bacterium]